ncbi:oligosaccharide flippase family protein [uncultured Tenacibaculum sp.]|uniref:oligosaccharide flippase family protein n=1 Tax=uncultured Tenacibaculum sp. TaxID=174713 RepID=UPI0026215FF4|nr:oligosaccharide flippase family protein [uncultured Tenacibaculum sp.]
MRSKLLPPKSIRPEQVFMLSALFVNAGNYLYNLIVGRILGPTNFADAAILITFLLVLSFIAMTFQLVTAKYTVIFDDEVEDSFIKYITKRTLIAGIILGIVIVVFSKNLQEIFNTSTSLMFTIFGIGVPIYFVMSVNRGFFQGKKKFIELSITYQGEMLSRLIITILLLYLLSNMQSSIVISIGILISLFFSLFPYALKKAFKPVLTLNESQKKLVIKFFILTAFYECTQIIINNSDILLVKHYFDNYNAGLYASLALIGRVVYFVAWMFVMLLLPAVVNKEKEGLPHGAILLKYVGYITMLSFTIVLGSYLFPELVVNILFGEAYIAIAPLLWKYALATSIFAISNVFAYYFLSIDQYIPVIITGILGITQVLLIIYFHSSLEEVVIVQILAMSVLLVVQLFFFFLKTFKKQKTELQ